MDNLTTDLSRADVQVANLSTVSGILLGAATVSNLVLPIAPVSLALLVLLLGTQPNLSGRTGWVAAGTYDETQHRRNLRRIALRKFRCIKIAAQLLAVSVVLFWVGLVIR